MREVRTPIIPPQPVFARVDGPHELNLEAICAFAAIGFFLDRDCYWKDHVALPPAAVHTLDEEGRLVRSEPWFRWHNTPRDLSFEEALDEFAALFEAVTDEQIAGRRAVLPLSGGLDSRTQAVALRGCPERVHAFGYSFHGGYRESAIARDVAAAVGFEFSDLTIPPGYLWERLDDLARTNGCYAEFTLPRQMAVAEAMAAKGEVYYLGHWGDVLFDRMTDVEMDAGQQMEWLYNRVVKRGGIELAVALWEAWGLRGSFQTFLRGRLEEMLAAIDVADTNARLRAFKSTYWATRWTAVNLSIYQAELPMVLPYYDDRLCEFICGVPEAYLADRRLQIAYIETRTPELADVTWQDHRPFSLRNRAWDRVPYNLPYRIWDRLKREARRLGGQEITQRNWEIQLLGQENQERLQRCLLEGGLAELVPRPLTERYLREFRDGDALQASHGICTLMALGKFMEHFYDAEAPPQVG